MQELQDNNKVSMFLHQALVYYRGKLSHQNVIVKQGIVTAIGQVENSEGLPQYELTEALVMPGMADVHVHLREPGFTHKETIETGTAAAAAGGYTLVCSMPNLNPAPDTLPHLQVQLNAIHRHALIQVIPYGCITLGQKGEGELVDFKSLLPYVCAFSDDGRGVQADDLMQRAMKQVAPLHGMIVAHCEVNELLNGGYIHQGVYAAEHGHKGICSESEWQQVKRDIELTQETGCAYHICHISTKETVELVRQAKAKGINVTCETAPHYLILCDEDLQEDGRFKMNPPIRSALDREALCLGLQDGTIDMIATDHAPHAENEKNRGLKESAFGIVGLETAFPLLYTCLVETGIISLTRLVELMVTNPRQRFKQPLELEVGQQANLTIMDLQTPFTIDSTTFRSMGKAQPFDGYRVKGRCLTTIYNGDAVWQHDDWNSKLKK